MITREDKIEQSVTDYVTAELRALGYGPDLVAFRESFPTFEERAGELTITTVAFGFNFDDGGRLMEIGSDLTERVYTIEFWVFGLDETIGRNVANVIRQICESNYGLIPLKDVGVAGQPVIDQLQVDTATVNRQAANEPQAWDDFVWTCTTQILDQYYPSQQ